MKLHQIRDLLAVAEKNVRVIETRVLVRQPGGWEAYPYFWNDAQTEATLANGGRVVRNLQFIGTDGVSRTLDYLVPSRNQCSQCHHILDAAQNQVLLPIGVKARYLNRNHDYGGVQVNQIQHLAELGKLTGAPPAIQLPSVIGVSTPPGQMQFTRTPSGPYCTASSRVRASTPPLLAV